VRIARDVGMTNEVILGGIAKGHAKRLAALPDADRHQRIKDTLDRWEAPFKLGAAPRDPRLRQAAVRALRDLHTAAEHLRVVREAAGVPFAPKVGENFDAQRTVMSREPGRALAWIEAEIAELEQRHATVRAERTAGVLTLPESYQHPESMDEAFTQRLAALKDLAEEARHEAECAELDAAIRPLIRWDLDAHLKRGVARETAVARATTVARDASDVRQLAGGNDELIAGRVERVFATA